MQALLLIIVSIIIAGCCTQPAMMTNQKMTISFIENESETEAILQTNFLETDGAIVKNWPFQQRECNQCSSIEKEYFTPKGPEKRVTVYDKNKNIVAFAIESRTTVTKLDGFTFKFSEKGGIEVCDAKECNRIGKYEEMQLSNCTIVLTDFQYIAPRQNIADSGKQLFQAAALCK